MNNFEVVQNLKMTFNKVDFILLSKLQFTYFIYEFKLPESPA